MELKTIVAQAHAEIQLGNRDQAEELYKQAIEMAKLDSENPDMLILVLLDLSVFYQEGEKLEEAERTQILAKEAQRQYWGLRIFNSL